MEMNQVRYFLSVCEHRNFTHAAHSSHVSQPSLTAAIKKLEEELGGTLFLRNRAGCQMTPLGVLVKPYFENIQRCVREAKAEAVRHVRLDRVPIKIGVGETVGQSKLSTAIERYRLNQPEADIELIVNSQEALLEGLRSGIMDIAITPIDASAELYRIDTLYREEYRVVVAHDHALSECTAVPLSVLAAHTMLDRPNCEMRDKLQKACAVQGYSIYAAYRSNRVDWLLELARKSTGAVILPVTAIPDDSGLVSLPIEGFNLERTIIALRYRHQPSRPELDHLLREVMCC